MQQHDIANTADTVAVDTVNTESVNIAKIDSFAATDTFTATEQLITPGASTTAA